mmetsp:Transcript_8117/g.25400  ORF Transcript_8117/g.25400 Transcript_8117/m.25400 type:complete len:482 (+) Transcript_8117:1098-2543(+)
MSLEHKIKQYKRKLKKAKAEGHDNKAKKYAEKIENWEAQLAAEAAEAATDGELTDSSTDDDDSDDDEAPVDRSFALDDEPDVAPRGLIGAPKLDWLGGRGAQKLLARACRQAVAAGGARDGFNAHDVIRIGLPDHLGSMLKWVKKLGFGDKLKKFALKMNRAAEHAARLAFPTFANAILGLEFSDARALATADEPDAISTWLQATCLGDLTDAFRGVVKHFIGDVMYYWKKLKRYWKKGDKMALGAVPDWDDATRDFDPEEHCLAKSLDGLFFLARQAEKALRDSVGAIADRLIQAVFKPLTSFFSLIKRPLKREIDDGAKVKKNPVTLALRKARKARKRATKWFQAQFEDDEDDDEEEPLGPNMDANEDMDNDDQLENGAYTFRLGDDGAGLLQKGGETIWTTAELDFDPYSSGVASGGCLAKMENGKLVIQDKEGSELWTYGEDGGSATTLVLSQDGGLSLTTDAFEPVEVLYAGDDDE